ncbi:MAG: ABC transporter ATP-binding protein/permease, partial [Clostridia bacterium]|nr:ABC transporter ATP-binding protein/permease [Clostridia bacterium]
EPMLAVLTFVLAPCAILLSHFLGQKFKDYHIKIQESEGRYRTFIQEQIQNILVVKAFCREKESVCESEKLQNQRLRWVTSRSKINTAGSAILSMGYWLGYLTAFIWGAFRLSEGAATFGTLAAFIQLVEQVQEPFICLAYDLPQLFTSQASAGRLMELDQLQGEKNLENMKKWKSTGICLENVSFSYDPAKEVLVNVNIRIQPGEIVALAGMSGEGKTTLIRLLLSLVSPKSGKVCFFNSAGHKTESSAAFRHFISYVPQGNTLFSGTIEENLRIGRPDATEKDIEQALQAANALDFIKKLPGGIHTKIGENGYGLSEGQAQRLSIARALIKKAPVLILDEATSALDIHTEKGILQSVKKLGASRTCIIITHRPTAYEVCDRVLKIQNGQLMEFCNPNRLSRGTEAV